MLSFSLEAKVLELTINYFINKLAKTIPKQLSMEPS